MTAVVANGLMSAAGLTGEIADARACDSRLEGLQTMVDLGVLDLEQATRSYADCLAAIPHV